MQEMCLKSDDFINVLHHIFYVLWIKEEIHRTLGETGISNDPLKSKKVLFGKWISEGELLNNVHSTHLGASAPSSIFTSVNAPVTKS